MIISTFKFYKNTPFNRLNETIYFKNKDEREKFLNHFSFKILEMNFVRDRLELRAPLSFTEAQSYNLIHVKGGLDQSQTDFYFQVLEHKYISDGVTLFRLVPDFLLTYCSTINLNPYLKGVHIERQHLTRTDYNNNIYNLATNDDVLKFNSMKIINKDFHRFKDMYVLFQSTADLRADFGTVDKPKFKASHGGYYDNIASPVDIYLTTLNNFVDMQEYLREYAWVNRNIINASLLPKEFFDIDTDFTVVKLNDGKYSKGVYKFNNGAHSSNVYFKDLKKSIAELSSIAGINHYSIYHHLMRTDYFNIRVSLNTGDYVDINPAKLPSKGLDLICQQVLGYFNQICIYPSSYQTKMTDPVKGGMDSGLQYEVSLVLNSFATIPVLIDNYNLSRSSNAYNREYNNSNTLTGQATRLFDNTNSVQDRISAGMGALGGLGGGVIGGALGLANKLNDDYNYYRKQSADFKDMAIQSPSVSLMDTSNLFAISNETFGLQVSYQTISKLDFDTLVRYHSKQGFLWDRIDNISDLYSMTKCNYAKLSGNWFIPNVPSEYMKIIRDLFEYGVYFFAGDYANSLTDKNPFNKIIMDNDFYH